MKFKFEKIIVWQRSMEFGELIHELTLNLPKDEKYNLSIQTKRAVDSIALNIAEGSIGQTNPEFKKFVSYSIRSLAEVITCLHKFQRRRYIEKSVYDDMYDKAYNLMNMLSAFRRNIK